MHAGMEYMERHQELRRDPRLLLPGAKTVVSIAFNYRQPNPFPQIATYALGEDYHRVLRRRLKGAVRKISDEFGGKWRICIDSAPILERYWALKCGIGRRSPVHGNIVVNNAGSMVFLAELLTTLDITLPREEEFPDEFMEISWSGCPGGALGEDGTLDARRCINYLTIEHRSPLTPQEQKIVGGSVFGCDRCQTSCRENTGPLPGVLPEFMPLEGLGDFLAGAESGFPLSRSPLSRSLKFRNRFSL